MPLIQQSFFKSNICTICAIFLYYWTQCINGFSLLLHWHVRKDNNPKNLAILSFFFVTERTQLNAAHAQLLEKLRPITFAETCWFLRIQSLEFQENWQKGIFYNTEHAVKTIYGELQKSPMSKFYLNSVDRKDLVSIRSGQIMKKSNNWIFLK